MVTSYTAGIRPQFPSYLDVSTHTFDCLLSCSHDHHRRMLQRHDRGVTQSPRSGTITHTTNPFRYLLFCLWRAVVLTISNHSLPAHLVLWYHMVPLVVPSIPIHPRLAAYGTSSFPLNTAHQQTSLCHKNAQSAVFSCVLLTYSPQLPNSLNQRQKGSSQEETRKATMMSTHSM